MPRDARILRRDLRIARETEDGTDPFQQDGAVMSPSVLVVIRNKSGDPAPILLFNLGEKMRAVQFHLPLGLPKTREKNSHDRGEKKAGVKAVAENWRHARR